MKRILVFSIYSLFIGIIISSCEKSNEQHVIQEPKSTSSITANKGTNYKMWVDSLFKDASFALLFDKLTDNSMDIQDHIASIAGENALYYYNNILLPTCTSYAQLQSFYSFHALDTAMLITRHAEPIAALLKVWDDNHTFADLTQADQNIIFGRIKDSLKNEDFVNTNSTNPIVIKMNEVVSRVSVGDQLDRLSLTWEEVSDCAFGTLLGVISNGWGTLRQLYGVIKGYNLGFSGIVNVTKSTLRTLVSGNAMFAVTTFALCVGYEAIF